MIIKRVLNLKNIIILKYFYIFLLFVQISFSQKSKMFRGKIICDDLALPKVEVVNETRKTIVISNDEGRFSILVSENDVLFFLSKKCELTKIVASKTILDDADFVVSLKTRSIELDEVEIKSDKKTLLKVTYGDISDIKLAKEAARPKNGIYTGQITQGSDLIEIGRMIGKLFKKKNKEKDALPVDFKKAIKSNFDTLFFLKTLNLKLEKINLFLDFCEADPKSKEIAQSDNVLTVIDFLMAKRLVFDKQ